MRSRALFATLMSALVLSACAEETSLDTTLDPAATQGDIAAVQAAFESPATTSFTEMGYEIDFALASTGGAVLRAPLPLVRDGASTSMDRLRSTVIETLTDDQPSAIPVSALGKTFVWNSTAQEYQISSRVGAPANGVRFILYTYDFTTGLPALPLNEVGYADLSRSGSSGTVSVYLTGGTKVVEYVATVGGTQQAPTFSVDGFAGTGANRAEFNLAFGYSATGAVFITWRTEVPARGLTSRVSLAIGQSSTTFGAVMRRGLRKIEMTGTTNASGGTLVVKVGDRVFARIVFTGETYTVTDGDGAPLTAEDEATLEQVFDWFSGAFEAPSSLLAPLGTLLDAQPF